MAEASRYRFVGEGMSVDGVDVSYALGWLLIVILGVHHLSMFSDRPGSSCVYGGHTTYSIDVPYLMCF